ncbi:UNVERIFIED_CONTAM: hypothetical protein Sradi_0719600 [Sesamum radiatum]|uniref:Reverse transcriptase n=1 Tax=Sesamum radiatum TaxID=300843 RepID=A0AAW2VRJ4_SESRA
MTALKSPGPDGRKGYMSFKLDISKVYDKVEWVFLKQAGREVLLKSVIPTYAMSCFKLLDPLLKEIQSLMARFCGVVMALIKFTGFKLCDSKLIGGIAFRRLQLFNLAMFSKQFWRILKSPIASSVESSVLVTSPRGMSLRPILDIGHLILGVVSFLAKDIFKVGCRWRVGSRSTIKVCHDPWLPRAASFKPITPLIPHLASLKVSDLTNQDTNDWNSDLVSSFLWPKDRDVIL